MDVFLLLVLLAIIAFARTRGLNRRLRLIEARLAGLEAGSRPAVGAGFRPAPAPEMESGPEDEPQAAPEPEPVAVAASVPEVPPSPAPAAAPRMSLEERLGTRWAVWVGGFALALGGIFLVRYSIERGLLGPTVRVVLAALLATALIVVGEWARRTERLHRAITLPGADIPSILTAAGTTVAYADVYAAHALYALLPPAVAFVLLGLVALATLGAAMLHGPALAAIGLIGAYLAPLLVGSREPAFWILYLYLAVVTAAAFTLARLRLWRWLALAAVALSIAWTLPGMELGRVHALAAHIFHVVAGFTLAALLIVAGLLFGPDAERGRVDWVSSMTVSLYLLAATALVLASRHEPAALTIFFVLVVATLAMAWRSEAAAAAVPVAALLAVLVIGRWAVAPQLEHLVAPSGPVAGVVPEPEAYTYGWHIALGVAFALLFGASGYLAQGRSQRPVVPLLWAAAAVFTPLAMVAALYFRLAALERSLPFSALALLLAAIFAVATETLTKRQPRPGLAGAAALFATGAIGALALAFTMALEKGWLTIALSLMVPGIAWVASKRPLPALRILAAVVGAGVIARLAWEPRIVGDDLGTTPVLNWLLYGYGIPAGAFWLGGYLLRRRADDAPARVIDAGAILLTVLLAFMEIRHAVTGGEIYARETGLSERALQVCMGLALTIGLERLRLRTASVVHDAAALVLAALTLMLIAIGLGIEQNPLFTNEPVGGAFVNLILLGYGLPAVLAAALAYISRGIRPSWFSITGAITAVALALAYLSLEVRRLYRGEVLDAGRITEAEQYTYSVVWLAFGIALLILGVRLRARSLRLASAAVVTLTVVKVFLVDLSGLTGIYQALSFIGLGIVLLGIGWLYQRLLFPPHAAAATREAEG
jgi:uncharacterized membrane protein